jgi:oxygen-independent coproporphyrinogen-3 oxidase
VLTETYLKALAVEIRMYGLALSDTEKTVSSLFIGGGTPSCLPVAGMKAIIEELSSSFILLPECEITVEVNPFTVDDASLSGLLEAGVNRLSIGIQALQDRLLEVLGRIHKAEQALAAVRLARKAGFRNLNLDFIFGIPGQTCANWLATLAGALSLAPEHIAIYGLQIEEGAPLERAVARGQLAPCPEELELSMYRSAIDSLTGHGYEHYEISNFARPDCQCSHNLVYWLNRPYLGLGPAAHSFLRGERFSNETSIERYSEKLCREEYPLETREKISLDTEMAETMFLGLRLIKGIDLNMFYRRFGRRAEDIYRKEIAGLLKDRLVEFAGERLRLTGKGLPLANRVFREFV